MEQPMKRLLYGFNSVSFGHLCVAAVQSVALYGSELWWQGQKD